jgi:fructokinase
MERVLVAGETLVDFLPVGGEDLADCDGFRHRPGGAPANVAVGLSHLGTRPAFWTRLCEDAFGEYLGDRLEAAGLPDRFLQQIPHANTTLAMVTPSAARDPEFAFYGDSEGSFGFEAGVVTDADLDETAWVHVGGVALTHPEGARATVDLVDRAASAGCIVSLDPNLRPDRLTDGVGRIREDLQAILSQSDVVCCSRSECAWLDGIEAASAGAGARELLHRGPHTAFVTDGEDGAALRASESAPWGSASASHAAFDVDVVDPTGAGDAFTAAVIDRLSRNRDGEDIEGLLAFASAAGAVAVRQRGAMAGLPTESAVRAFLDAQ